MCCATCISSTSLILSLLTHSLPLFTVFITDADEYLYKILTTFNHGWVEEISKQHEDEAAAKEDPESRDKLQRIESELEKVQKEMELMREKLGVRSASTVPQDEDDDFYSASGSMIS